MRLLVSIAISGLVLAAMGCASSDPPHASAPLTSISRSRAHALAPLLTIRQADLPEFKVTAHAAGAQEGEDPRYADCLRASAQRTAPHAPGVQAARRARPSGQRGSRSQAARQDSSSSRPLASAKSRQVSANNGYHLLGASSSVSIMPTSTAARLEILRAKDLSRTCMEHAIRAEIAGKHVRLPIAGVVIESRSVKVKGADASVAYEAVIGFHGAPLVGYMDLIGFSYGQDVVLLHTFHASTPVPAAMDERLLGLLVARAKSHDR